MMKTCKVCKTTKSVFDFVLIDKGLSNACRKCEPPMVKTDEELEQEIIKSMKKQERVLWVQENKESVRKAALKRYRAYKQQTPKWLTDEDKLMIQSFYATALFCSKSLGVNYHVDHIVPIQGKDVCGLHVPWNLQVITQAENSRKKNHHG